MFQMIQKITDKAMNVFMFMACAYLLYVVFACFVQVCSRYVFNTSVAWTEETARYAFICMGMLGSTVTLRHNQHVKIDLLENALPAKGQYIQRIIIDVAIVFASTVFFIEGINLVRLTWGVLGTAVPVPVSIFYYSVPLCGLGCAWVGVMDIAEQLLQKPEEGRPSV